MMRTIYSSPASDRVWSLVSGLPGFKRGSRQFMTFQAFIDDSYGPNTDKDPYFVLAGFVGTYANWAAFSDAWQAELDRPPRLAYFKMNEAIRSKSGPWKGIGDIERRIRIDSFVQIVRKHALVRVDSSIKRSDYKKCVKGKLPKELDHPYVLSFLQIITSVFQYQQANNWNAQIDFVFDEQQQFSKELLGWWDVVKRLITANFGEHLIGTLVFQDDKNFLPLQAADCYAWSIRNDHSQNKIVFSPRGYELEAIWDMPRAMGEMPNLCEQMKKFPPSVYPSSLSVDKGS